MITAEQAREQLKEKKKLSLDSIVENLSIETEILKAIDNLDSNVSVDVPLAIAGNISKILEHYGFTVSFEYGEDTARATIKW